MTPKRKGKVSAIAAEIRAFEGADMDLDECRELQTGGNDCSTCIPQPDYHDCPTWKKWHDAKQRLFQWAWENE